MNVLVTGGAGYIGSHAALRLLEDGHAVTVVDDLSRGNHGAIDALRRLGGDFQFLRAGLSETSRIDAALRNRRIDAAIHFAALTYVGESVEKPELYEEVNVRGTQSLLQVVEATGVSRLVFSSSAATYGEPPQSEIPIRETCPQKPINPYGSTKLQGERMLAELLASRRTRQRPFACAALRYFNVAGADRLARIGEDHRPETHLVPICLQAALGQRQAVTIFGNDYPTPDGTCIRDYVHVEDLIDAHVTVLHALDPDRHESRIYNIGIGRGYSVREVIETCRRVSGVNFRAIDGERRAGDPPSLYADPAKIKRELNWSAKHQRLDDIVASAWRWHQQNPNGYLVPA